MSRAEDLRAELELIELEEQFVKAKKAGTLTPDRRADLRAARRAFRDWREGSAAVKTETVKAKAKTNESGS